MSAAIRAHSVVKGYVALVRGEWTSPGGPLSGTLVRGALSRGRMTNSVVVVGGMGQGAGPAALHRAVGSTGAPPQAAPPAHATPTSLAPATLPGTHPATAPATHQGQWASMAVQRLPVPPGWAGQVCTPLLVWLHTGRRHQVRALLAAAGHPILGDARYGPGTHPAPAPRGALPKDGVPSGGANVQPLALHAVHLVVPHPTRPGSVVSVSSALPGAWARWVPAGALGQLRGAVEEAVAAHVASLPPGNTS